MDSGNVSGTARDLGIAASALARWKKQYEEDKERAFPGRGNPRDAELTELKRENARIAVFQRLIVEGVKKPSVSVRICQAQSMRPDRPLQSVKGCSRSYCTCVW